MHCCINVGQPSTTLDRHQSTLGEYHVFAGVLSMHELMQNLIQQQFFL